MRTAWYTASVQPPKPWINWPIRLGVLSTPNHLIHCTFVTWDRNIVKGDLPEAVVVDSRLITPIQDFTLPNTMDFDIDQATLSPSYALVPPLFLIYVMCKCTFIQEDVYNLQHLFHPLLHNGIPVIHVDDWHLLWFQSRELRYTTEYLKLWYCLQRVRTKYTTAGKQLKRIPYIFRYTTLIINHHAFSYNLLPGVSTSVTSSLTPSVAPSTPTLIKYMTQQTYPHQPSTYPITSYPFPNITCGWTHILHICQACLLM